MKINKLTALTASLLLLGGGVRAQAQAFTGRDVGAPSPAGSVVTNSDGTLSISGSGDDIWNASDNFYYYYTPVSGENWAAVVRVRDLQGGDATWAKAELMVRQSDTTTGPTGPDAFIANMVTKPTGQNIVQDQYRSTSGGSADQLVVSTVRPILPNTWLCIRRSGSVFNILYSFDGTSWSTYTSIDTASADVAGSDNATTFGVPWPNDLLVGLGVTSHANGSLAKATISDLKVINPFTGPNAIGFTQQPVNATNYVGSEVAFTVVATNNSVPSIIANNYQWYKNGVAVPGATGPRWRFLVGPDDAGAQVYCQASLPAPYSGTAKSATATIGVLPGALTYTNGLKMEDFAGAVRANVESGNVGPGILSRVDSLDLPGGYGDNRTVRISGWFIPPKTDTYTFFLATDDDSDLFLSTDDKPANKKLIAQEVAWSGARSWLNSGDNQPTSDSSKRSDQWADTNGTPAWVSTTPLTAGQKYYLELVRHNGGGGDNIGVTYQTATDINDPNWPNVFTNGVPSLLQASNHNIALITGPTTFMNWDKQPTDLSAFEGGNAKFTASVKTDSELLPFYQWYRDGTNVPGATQSTFSINPATLADNGAKVYVTIHSAEENFALTSSVVTLTVQQAILEKGFAKVEFWQDATRATVEGGTLGDPTYTTTTPKFEASVNGESGDNYGRRISGFFIPPTTGNYVFFVNSDDDSDLFLSTDATPANKKLIAQETSWSAAWAWNSDGGNATPNPQKRSDQWTDANGTPAWVRTATLNAGQKYYMEVVHHEGGGGDNIEVTYKKQSDPDPLDGTDSALAGNVIGMYAPRCSYVAFAQQPANVTVDPLGLVTLSALGVTDSTTPVGATDSVITNNFVVYQWQKNGVDIPRANTATYIYGPVMPSENGAVFTCKIRALGLADSALNPIWSNSTPATLTVRPNVFEPGFAKVDFWQGQTRAPVEAGTAGAPTYTTYVSQWSMGSGIADNYARRFSGFFVPATADSYVFFVNSDDDADLFLSTDATPANKHLIAQETTYGTGLLHWLDTNSSQSQRNSAGYSPDGGASFPYSSGIKLDANTKYYMEAVHHDGTGGDYCQVLVTDYLGSAAVTNGQPVNMTGGIIGTYVPKCSYVAFAKQPQSVSVMNLGSASFTVEGISDSTASLSPDGPPTLNNYVLYQWYKNGAAIAGATQPTLLLPEVPLSDNGAQFICKIRALGYTDGAGNVAWSNSVAATLTVVSTPPTAYATIFTDGNATPQVQYLNIAFNKRMDPTTLASLANYQISGGLTATAVTVKPDGTGVKLTVTGTATGTVKVTISGVKDAEGVTIAANTVVSASQAPLTCKDIGAAGDPAFPTIEWVDGPGDYTIIAQGSDIWNNADGFNFTYEQKTGDFDVVVRQKSNSHTSNWAKGGLMAREDLTPGSRNWNIVNDPIQADGIQAPDNSGMGANAVECNARVTTGGATASWGNGTSMVPAYPNAWVRLKRAGNVLTAFASTDGIAWTTMGTTTVTLPQALYVGICTTAHNNDPAGSTTFQYYNTAEYADYNSSYVAQTTTPIVLSTTVSGGNLVISWTPAGGHLQSCTALGGTWTDEGTANPATIPMSGAAKFFRVAQ